MTIEEIKEKWGDSEGYISCCVCPLGGTRDERCRKYMPGACLGLYDAHEAIQRYFADIEEETDTEPKSVRKEILTAAINCVCSDRDTQYGSQEDSFKLIARLWSDYTGHEITPHDAAVMMALLKVARIKTGQYKDDSYIDAAGYIACAAEIGRCNDE